MPLPRADFDRHLLMLKDDVLSMGSMVEKSVFKAVDALKRRDLKASEEVVKDDDLIDQKRYEIEERCVDLIATQQPMARDLRMVMALLHITLELERMGDYSEGIARISIMMGEEAPIKPLIDVPRMAERAAEMLRHSLDALVNRDVTLAQQVWKDDDEVDMLHDQVYNELLMIMIQDPKTIKRATYLLWVAHNLERFADRATNIAERAVYLVTGKFTEASKSTNI